MRISRGGLYRLSLMKFTLVYEGDLPSNGSTGDKWKIRQQLHPQLAHLWRIHPALLNAWPSPVFPEAHHTKNQKRKPAQVSFGGGRDDALDLAAPIQVGDYSFIPLVRDSYALKCGLDIIFLRKEEPGGIIKCGDIDNRLKTLFDALSIPNNQQIIKNADPSEAIHCLMEDDKLVTKLTVDTRQLLSPIRESPNHVKLIIDVDVRVTMPMFYNQSFLGD